MSGRRLTLTPDGVELAYRHGIFPMADEGSGETTFPFESWNAEACYALDPGDNIVELIAHHELPDESPRCR